ncbi:MAG: DUF4296 domain-containing protein [Candidatus Zhuqueibacterota bacterium]
MFKVVTMKSLLLMGSLFLLSCRHGNDIQPIDEKQFVQIYCDVVVYADLIDVQLRQAFVDSVLQSHQVTREKFQQSIDDYSRDKRKWKQIFQSIVSELEAREKLLAPMSDSLKTQSLINTDTE